MSTLPRARTLLRAAVVGGATIATAAVAGAQGGERHALRGAAAVWNLVGTVRVVAGSGSDVTVDVVRRGRDASKLRVEAGDFRGTSAVRVIYPDDDIVYPDLPRGSRMRTRVRSDGTWGGGNYGAFGSGDTQIRSSGSGTEAWADVTVAVPSGGKVAVHLAAGEATVTNVNGDLDLDVDAASVTADGTRGRLAVDAGSGRVRVSNAQGDVDLDLGSGPVELRDVSATRLKVDGGSGSLTGANLSASSIDLDLGSGSARLSNVTSKDVKIDNGSGSVDLDLASDIDAVRIDTGSGSITLRIPATLGAQVDIDSGSGGIESDVPIQVTRKESDHLRGQIGDGRGRIVIDGGSGGVRILKH
ncbi:protein of unknown function DUF4098 [Gemmatirosa kalamazoonensis]|uniref:DUF4097 domain-containing protein n=1 Tax=Gemmatirosa kalamazoonensis TaxID=861299 RepID=W0RLR0_9BACT|nr:DUF4097 family beta strand repeat-containing protein [Gemmatirosa kalamazoonensis]AHG92024.1 protein of unknown function DUF4098 [Gemmatirosa kalamazoonensis]